MIRAALLVLAATPALANGPERPESLQGLLDYHRAACSTHGGTLSVMPDAVTEAEFNGDGQTDFVLDSSKLDCSTRKSMFCVYETGCELSVFVRDAEHTLIVKAWSLKDAGDRQHLVATIDGELLNLPLDLTTEMTWDDAHAGLKLAKPDD